MERRRDSNREPLSQETDLAFPLVQIDANMVHGWPPSPCAIERVISLWGTLCHHVESGVSRFIPSTLVARQQLAGWLGCAATCGREWASRADPDDTGPSRATRATRSTDSRCYSAAARFGVGSSGSPG